jgi:hypothetical protein
MSTPHTEPGAAAVPAPRVFVVMPDAGALRQIAGLLGWLSARKRQVFVGVQHDPPGATSLGRFDAAYSGLSVKKLPALEDDGWQSLAASVRARLESGPGAGLTAMLQGIDKAIPPSRAAASLLRRQSPHALIVSRLHHGAHRDYLRAARQLGIPSVYLALGVDDVSRGGLALDPPDCVAVWNRAQRREATELGLLVRRTAVLGVHLWTDVLETRETVARDEWCRRLGIDPARRVLVVAPAGDDAETRERWLAAWREASGSATDARLRDAATVVVAGLGSSPDFAEQYDGASALHQALSCADAVVTGDESIALEGLARAVPVIAWPDRGFADRLMAAAHAESEWPCAAASVQDALAQVSRVLDGGARAGTLAAARAFVRPHGEQVEPGFLLGRLLKDLELREVAPAAPAPRPALARWAASRRWPAVVIQRPQSAASGALFLVALPEALAAHWRALFEVLAERGHRVALAAERDAAALVDAVADLHGVWVTGRLAAPHRDAAARAVAALDLRVPELSGGNAAADTRWRRRVEGVAWPAGLRGLEALQGSPAGLARVRALGKRLDASLAPSRVAARLVDRERPDAVVVLPAFDPSLAVDSWVAHLDLMRAARARGVPAMASRLGGDPAEEALALGAMRPNGVSRSTAAGIIDALEQRLRAGTRGSERDPFAPLSRAGAFTALNALSAAAGVRRRLAGAR